MWDFKWFSHFHRPAPWTLERVFTIFRLQADQHYCKCPMITITAAPPDPPWWSLSLLFRTWPHLFIVFLMLYLPEKKKRYCLFPQRLGPRPIRAINIQTGTFASWGRECWHSLETMPCPTTLTQRHTSAQPCCLHTQRETQTQREKSRGYDKPLTVYALPVLYAPVPKQGAKLFTWENPVNPHYLTDAHMKLYWWQRKHHIVEAGNKHWNSNEKSWSTASNSPRSGTAPLSRLSQPQKVFIVCEIWLPTVIETAL